jgi:hypothetical protein
MTMWRCYGLLCQTHEECLWVLNTLIVCVKVALFLYWCQNLWVHVSEIVLYMCHKWSWKLSFFVLLLIWGVGSFMGILWFISIRIWLVRLTEFIESEIRRSWPLRPLNVVLNVDNKSFSRFSTTRLKVVWRTYVA